jgi:probable phosphoglycerate mutase
MALFFTLARHGETEDNARGVFQGQGGIGLNARGRQQAGRLGERLRRSPPGLIVSSDLERAVETARIVAEACGVPFETEPGFREIDVGAWTGKSREEIAIAFPEEWAAWRDGLDVRRGGGETYAELSERLHRAMEALALRQPDRTVLVVSHGGAIRSWIGKILGLPRMGMRTLGGVANTALSVVERDASSDAYCLHSWNDAAHLEVPKDGGDMLI